MLAAKYAKLAQLRDTHNAGDAAAKQQDMPKDAHMHISRAAVATQQVGVILGCAHQAAVAR